MTGRRIRAHSRTMLINPHVTSPLARSFGTGVVAMAPWLLGVVPFGMIIGVTIADSSVSPWVGWATGLGIYAGSAQLVAIELLDGGAAPVVVVLTVLVINARLLLYSASIGPHWRGAGRWYRVLAAYLLIDPSYAVGMDRYGDRSQGSGAHAHYLGAGITLWVAWQLAIVAGLTLGASVPASLHLELVVPLFLIAELMGHVTTRAGRTVAAVAAFVAIAAVALPLHLGIVAAIAVGVTAGARVEGGAR
jgi:predicted branched-subunit amino acid permease